MACVKNFVASIKSNNNILREQDKTVLLPFGSEYSIYMKNLDTRKVLVSIYIDGKNILNDNKLVIEPNKVCEIDCFLENIDGKNRKLKFIQKTEKIQQHRGDKIDDGIIRIEFQYEEPIPVHLNFYPYGGTSIYSKPTTIYDNTYYGSNLESSISCNVSNTTTSISNNLSNTSSFSSKSLRSLDSNLSISNCSASLNATMDSFDSLKPTEDEGITVKGSESTQRFKYGSIGKLENEKHVITLQIKGVKSNGAVVEEAITVKTIKECKTCGTKNKSNFKFCTECGTFLD